MVAGDHCPDCCYLDRLDSLEASTSTGSHLAEVKQTGAAEEPRVPLLKVVLKARDARENSLSQHRATP